MKKMALVSLILMLSTGLAFAKDYTVTKKAGVYTLQISVDKNPSAVGKNRMEIGIKDMTESPVVNAVVSVEYAMPAMPGMGAMNYKAKGQLVGSRYVADLDFSMPGSWNVNIKITRNGKTQTAKLNIDVQ